MRLITLSDHAADQQRKAQAGREAQDLSAQQEYERKVAERAAHIAGRRAALSDAFRSRRWLSAAIGLLALIASWLTSAPRRPASIEAGRDEAVWGSGEAGEKRVHAHLHDRLGDDWTALAGYCNGKGEIDLVLVGPPGLVAIEIKTINGVVHCANDEWCRDKYDRYGNLVQSQVPIRDRSGRSPSRQLREPVVALGTWLGRQSLPTQIPIATAVVLAHESSRVGRLTEPGVTFVGLTAELDVPALLPRAHGDSMPAINVAAVAELIRRDHDFHERRKHERNRSTAGGRESPR